MRLVNALTRIGLGVLALVLVLAGCDKGKLPDIDPPGTGGGSGGAGGGGGGGIGSILPSLPLPKAPDGKFILIEIGKSRIDLDPTLKDPLTALGGCTDLITYCYAPGTKSVDDCVASAKSCETQQPWEALAACCPSACKTDYATARSGGSDELAAFDQVFFQNPSCFPGVMTAVGGAP